MSCRPPFVRKKKLAELTGGSLCAVAKRRQIIGFERLRSPAYPVRGGCRCQAIVARELELSQVLELPFSCPLKGRFSSQS
jgi:hypothetical protein